MVCHVLPPRTRRDDAFIGVLELCPPCEQDFHNLVMPPSACSVKRCLTPRVPFIYHLSFQEAAVDLWQVTFSTLCMTSYRNAYAQGVSERVVDYIVS